MAEFIMVLLGGANGVGKSTAKEDVVKVFGNSLIWLNSDDRTEELKEIFPEKSRKECRLVAVKETDEKVAIFIQDGKSFGVETVLSSGKYRDDVLEAKKKGFLFILYYISVFPPDIAADRVEKRMKSGKHGIPREDVFKYYQKSHSELEWFASHADIFVAFDNSAPAPSPLINVAEKIAGHEIVYHVKGLNPELDRVISNLQKNSAANTDRPAP